MRAHNSNRVFSHRVDGLSDKLPSLHIPKERGVLISKTKDYKTGNSVQKVTTAAIRQQRLGCTTLKLSLLAVGYSAF